MDELLDGANDLATPDRAEKSTTLATRLLPGSPLRPVDWRWERAGQLLEQGVRRRRWDDGWVSRIRRYRAALARAGGRAGEPRVSRSDPAIHEACQLRRGPPRRRRELEARILAGQTDSDVAARMGLKADAVAAFEAAFFSVRDGLDASDWIHFFVIGPRAFGGFDPADEETVLKLFAYNLGPLVLDALLASVFTGGRPPADPRLADLFRLSLGVQALEVTPGNAAGVLRLYSLGRELERREAGLDASRIAGPVVTSPGGAASGPQVAPERWPGTGASGPTMPESASADFGTRRLGATG
jgi:hypothetical protein